MKLLRDAEHLDLVVGDAASRDRPVWRAASGVAAAVAACSPPRRSRLRSMPQGKFIHNQVSAFLTFDAASYFVVTFVVVSS
ncbi:hypothetical protein NDU88_002120 [Pleurodeles waltl]|uniref:Uncharacterized protein n=1 Tax=Pleurodeles waltl TaxID=8319 RepID=A0AAV7LBG2_PLEWA|nr:hypothetical protein NDU88_002120 [Pleurodeles waltl]